MAKILGPDGLPITTADGNNHNRFPDPMAARQVVMARGAKRTHLRCQQPGGRDGFRIFYRT